jgi:hypothetical protein
MTSSDWREKKPEFLMEYLTIKYRPKATIAYAKKENPIKNGPLTTSLGIFE